MTKKRVSPKSNIGHNTPLYSRMWDELSRKEQNILKKIKSESDIQLMELLATEEDDHTICAGVKVNGVKFMIGWCGWEVACMFKYNDSFKARVDAVDEIMNFVQCGLDEAKEEARWRKNHANG